MSSQQTPFEKRDAKYGITKGRIDRGTHDVNGKKIRKQKTETTK